MRKTRIYFFLALVITLTLAGCSGTTTPDIDTPIATATQPPLPTRTPLPTPTPTPDGSTGTVIIWHSWEQPEVDRMVQVIVAFQAAYPDVQFDVLYVPEGDLRARFAQAAEAGGGPTLVMAPGDWGQGLLIDGLIVDLSGLISHETSGRLSPAASLAAQVGPTWLGLPYAIEGVVLYRNREIITSAPASFDALLSLAQAATTGEVNGAILERSFYFSGAHMLGIGGQWLNEAGLPAFNSERGREWLDLLLRFSDAGGTTFLTDQDLAAFQEGRAGLIIEGSWNINDLEAALGAGRLAIDPWPSAPNGNMSGFIQVESLYVASRATAHDRAATVRFMEFFLSPPAQAILADRSLIPVTLDAAPTDPLVAQAAVALAGGRPYPADPEFELFTTPLEIMLQGVFDGSLSPEQALARAETDILALLSGAATSTPAP